MYTRSSDDLVSAAPSSLIELQMLQTVRADSLKRKLKYGQI
jgi:hypothetical protein